MLPCERKRYLTLWHAHLGFSSRKIAEMGMMSTNAVRRTIHLYREGGLEALKERDHPGRASRLTPEVAQDVVQLLAQNDRTWNARTLSDHLEQEYGIVLKRSALTTQLHHLNLTWQRTRYVVAGQADPTEKAEFKAQLETVKKGLNRDS